MSDELIQKCSKEGCDVGTTGKCSAGHENHAECPYYIKSEVGSLSPKLIKLASGQDLTDNETIEITANTLTRLIVLAGAVGSGKTTLLASLYGTFLEKPFAGYIFAGSKTLLGFEKRCHLARLSSNGIIGDTERTKSGHDHNLLHLRVRKHDLQSVPQEMLFTDISGETYNQARDFDDECKRLKFINRADHFGLMIDGEKISNLKTRQSAFQDAKILLRRCVENNMFLSSPFIEIIFTKYDIYKNNKEATDVFIPQIIQEFKNSYKDILSRLEFFEVAAMNGIGARHDLERLLVKWTEKSPYLLKQEEHYQPDLSQSREFNKFSAKYFREKR
jgi:energy-coupling factor transporter ATP-binding protein EcfA2